MLTAFGAYGRLCRLHRPVGILLLMFPCWWGVALAAPDEGHLKLLLLFAAGAAAMRGAGCTLNDIIDQDIDRHVRRTKDRPIARGEISIRSALVFFAFQCLGGLGVLLALPPRCWPLSVIGLALLGVYPFMKRLLPWPQLVLGLGFNLGVIFGIGAVLPYEAANWPAVLSLYGAGIAWTIGYDTLYALQDKEDDIRLGVNSTAISFGEHAKEALIAIYGLMIALLASVGYWADGGVMYYGLLGIGALITLLLLNRLPLNDPTACQKAFQANTYLGGLVWIALECLNG